VSSSVFIASVVASLDSHPSTANERWKRKSVRRQFTGCLLRDSCN
jgi:hypothetical protein